MRSVPPTMTAAWVSGDFTGPRRPCFRMTIQRPHIDLHDVGYNLYADIMFGATEHPLELPNGRTLQWDRSTDVDIATCQIELYNCEPLPVGAVRLNEALEGLPYRPGYFTFNWGDEVHSVKFDTQPTPFFRKLMPDNVIRTYEGYGFDVDVCPEKDPHLVQTGVWMIDEVDYGTDGIIRLTLRDLGRLLSDQTIFPPVVPINFYPVSFERSDAEVGFVSGRTYTKLVNSGGDYDPRYPPPVGWTGPLTPPAIGDVPNDGDASSVVPFSPIGAVPAGYVVDGYRLFVNNQLDPKTIPAAGPYTAEATGLTNGAYYISEVAAQYREVKTGRREIGNRSGPRGLRPHRQTGGYPRVLVISADTDRDGNTNVGETHPGMVAWTYSLVGSGVQVQDVSFTVIAFKSTGERIVKTVAADPATTGALDLQMLDDGDELAQLWNVLVTPDVAGVAGQGLQYFAQTASASRFFNTPVYGAPPQEPPYKTVQPVAKTIQHPVSPGSSSNLTQGDDGPRATAGQFVYTVVKGDWLIKIAARFNVKGGYRAIYDIPANRAVVGDNPDLIFPGQKLIIPAEEPVQGTVPGSAFDNSPSSSWLSAPLPSPGRPESMAWIEGLVGGKTIDTIRVTVPRTPVLVYVSVFSRGKWVTAPGGGVIPYVAASIATDIDARLPFVQRFTLSASQADAPVTVKLAEPIVGVTRVRLTFHNLPLASDGTYRAGLRLLEVFSHETDQQVTQYGPLDDDTAATVVQSYTVTIPPSIKPGAGERPGTYNDYTDIVKLFCAWAGFFWPRDGATQLLSDGSEQTYDFGIGPYGLPNQDPVLGTQPGRVWGDFEQTGTAGPSPIPVPNWDKKSLLDGISYVRDIIGFLFFVDETGGVVWRSPNIYSIGNDVRTLSDQTGRTTDVIQLTGRTNITGLAVKLASKNVRERVFIANTNGQVGDLAAGYNPNPIGLRRVGGWTDQHFASEAECAVMADFIAMRQLFSYRTDSVSIQGYPAIQVNDQVYLEEASVGESYFHYVKSISSAQSTESGDWTYTLGTHWLGEQPFDNWVFNPDELKQETQDYLTAIGKVGVSGVGDQINSGQTGTDTGIIPGSTVPGAPLYSLPGQAAQTQSMSYDEEIDMAAIVRVQGQNALYVTNGIHRRWVQSAAKLNDLFNAGLIKTKAPRDISADSMNDLVLVGPGPS